MMFFGFLGYNRAEVSEVDRQRRKELLESYKFRRPEMCVISYHCKASGDVFLDTSKDITAGFNSTNMKLSANWHPNKQLQDLWNEHGAESFELSVIETLEYDDPQKDHAADLEKMIESHLAANSRAKRVWR